MQNFFDWFKQQEEKLKQTWLILGKGPSYAQVNQYDITSHNVLTLNHVIREQKALLAHMIDFDVPVDCAEAIDQNAGYLVMPWVPHIHNVPTEKNLEELISTHPVLNKLNQQGRILWYDFITGGQPKGNYPVITTDYFSVEAVMNLLGYAGVRKIYSLGIDGGKTYSSSFHDLNNTKLLANGQPSFSLQFNSIRKIIADHNIDYTPLNMQETPIRIFVGSTEPQLIPTRVLEYSIRKNTKEEIEVFPLYKANITIPTPKDPANRPRTPFSFQRFFIPQLKNYKGRAIYLDSDMQVFTDISKLWNMLLGDADVLSAYETSGTARRPQFSVMLLNCERLKWDLPAIVQKLDNGELDYAGLMYEMRVAENIQPVIEAEWNSLEYYEEGKTNLLHYTDMNKQPWLYRNNKLGSIWVRELTEAIENEFISVNELKEHLDKGYMRPSLWYQIKRKHYDVTNLPKWVKRFDKFFVPPHEKQSKKNDWHSIANNIFSHLIRIVYS
jgi:hypothetical protein